MVIIREATAQDIDVVYDLMIAIAEHHDQAQFVVTDKSELAQSGFGPMAKFGVLLAEVNGKIAGYASYTWPYSIWLGADYMNIDDEMEIFYVNEYETLNYRHWNSRWSSIDPKTLEGQYGEQKKQFTVLKPLDSFITIDRNFQVLNSDRILQKGYMGWERIAEILPIEFEPK